MRRWDADPWTSIQSTAGPTSSRRAEDDDEPYEHRPFIGFTRSPAHPEVSAPLLWEGDQA